MLNVGVSTPEMGRSRRLDAETTGNDRVDPMTHEAPAMSLADMPTTDEGTEAGRQAGRAAPQRRHGDGGRGARRACA